MLFSQIVRIRAAVLLARWRTTFLASSVLDVLIDPALQVAGLTALRALWTLAVALVFPADLTLRIRLIPRCVRIILCAGRVMPTKFAHLKYLRRRYSVSCP